MMLHIHLLVVDMIIASAVMLSVVRLLADLQTRLVVMLAVLL
jgi:hypothetical protein